MVCMFAGCRKGYCLTFSPKSLTPKWLSCKDIRENIRPYFRQRCYLSSKENSFIQKNRVVIPPSHQFESSRSPAWRSWRMLAHSYVWWPYIDNDIENKWSSHICLLNQFKNPEVYNLYPLTNKCFQSVHYDFFDFKGHIKKKFL